MSATLESLRQAAARLDNKGKLDRDALGKLLFQAMLLLEQHEEAQAEREEVITDLTKRLNAAEELLRALLVSLEVGARAVMLQISASAPISIMRDTAPFRNVMEQLYGLTALGGDKKRRRR